MASQDLHEAPPHVNEHDLTPSIEFTTGEETEDEGMGKAPQYNKTTFEVLRLEASGRSRQVYARRRDLLKEHRLQPRDLRRIDLSVDVNKAPPSITVKDNVILLCLGGVRLIVTGDKALLFEPQSPEAKKFLEVMQQHMQARQHSSNYMTSEGFQPGASHTEYMNRYYKNYQQKSDEQAMTPPPFELEVVEAALMVATSRLEGQMAAVTSRVQTLLSKLPGDISPVNLEELRRVKGALVEVEQKADTLKNMLEELMDDEDELREMNLSSRPRREERRRQRERERLERELERAREIKEEIEERLEDGDEEGGGMKGVSGGSSPHLGPGGIPLPPSPSSTAYSRSRSAHSTGYPRINGSVPRDSPYSALQYELDQNGRRIPWSPSAGASSSFQVNQAGTSLDGSMTIIPPGLSQEQRRKRVQDLRAKFDRARLLELRSKFNWGDRRDDKDEKDSSREQRRSRSSSSIDRDDVVGVEREEWISRLEGSVDNIQEAQEALEEMVEAEEEDQEVEEVEDLLEYYLQRASATQDEAERLLAGARDLEESIGVSLSARRFEVNRLELTLSIGSFAATIGAMVAGIFGMNMRSKLETSVASFWGIGLAIVLGCLGIFMAILKYTQRRRIL
ncbi:hypothetical protein CEUSTIGMA_g9651.t1 [Chlamydomonas eustigma]|uniref:Magnesium transporter n=1 Tax=Chlamydomonas eustigma TaxID=1157962 RepID=A0A250XGP0_9CHLO|nr:hypothetical protein CEUSTIGMA_g9651.t1 [Chlamydomonas eustigma]|eukprot:GAX82223.1 hypothetical protein CEUSTIGMA_g9651.t1 [Chlamydomonas eustigma]